MKRIDTYIIKKFLSTYFFAIGLILAIAVVFDASEKIDDFIENSASLKVILFDYYLNFIPYFANLFSSLFVFIAVIFFTSKMAYASEIIAMLSSGISFRRILFPFIIGAVIITGFNFVLGYYVIPEANKGRLDFQSVYLKGSHKSSESNVHKQIEPGFYIYLESFNINRQTGYSFTMESIENDKLVSRLSANRIIWDTTDNKWTLEEYKIRRFDDLGQKIESGMYLDTLINISPDDFTQELDLVTAMTHNELDDYIEMQRIRGTSDITNSLLEKHRRVAYPFSTFILTLLAVVLSAKKVRGGIGLQIGLGILLSFTYILFMQFADSFALSGSISPSIAVWIPNMIYGVIGVALLRFAPK
ncbi:MAG: LptF/LptG family permease [Bacteroidota bacterium]|nr:LptF/LptG family permease [Bacteroidota bacterium]